MKKYFLSLLILIPFILFSYSIEETLSQIKSLKKELSQNEKIVEKKISNLKKNNPLFAEQDTFESDVEYLTRMSKASPQIKQIRKQYLDDLWQEIGRLRGRLFETTKIQINLDPKKYNPNTEKWPITIKHLSYQKENESITLDISKKNAKELYRNWSKVKKTGFLTIDIGDKIGLAKLLLEDPITGCKLELEFQPMQSFKHSGGVNSVAFSPDGKFLVTDDTRIFNLETGNEVKKIKHIYGVNSVVFSPDGKFLVTGAGNEYSSDNVHIFNLEIGSEVKSFKHSGRVYSIAFSPDGKFLATGDGSGYDSGNARIFNLETGSEVSFFYHNKIVNSVAFSPDGKFLATGDRSGNARIFNLEIGSEVKSFKHSGIVYSIAFSPDGKFLATGAGYKGGFGNARIFNLETGSEVKSFKHSERVNSVAFSQDGKFLATGDGSGYSSGNARIFNLETGNEVQSFKHSERVNSVAFSQDGKFLATGAGYSSGNARIYRTLIQQEEDVLAQKAISLPPSLSASVNFIESSGNKYLDALEKGELAVTIKNNGKGSGKGLAIKFNPERIEGLNYNNSYIEEIPAGEEITVKIPIEAYIDVTDTTNILRVNFDEINGFPPAPVEIEFSTKSYLKPEMFIVDIGIEDNNNNGMIESGETTKLTVRIGNKGKGIASGAYAKFYSEDNVFITDSYQKVVSLGDLEFNQYIDISLEFFVNDKAPDEIPLYVDFTEATGISGVEHLRLPILKSERARKIKRTTVAGIDKDYGDINFEDDLSIDIEQNIPKTDKINKNALAIIFGIENYRNVSNVNYAYRDASFMKKYFSNIIGIPEEQIYFKANDEVTLGEFRKIFSDNGWLDKRVVENKTDVYFYYAGHGAPAIKEKKAFLIPYDGDPNYPVQTGYSLEAIFENLSDLKANSATVFFDACFTGADRENEMLLADARPISIQLENTYINNVTVFSATSNNEISSSFPKKKHGLFSYYLMKGMKGEADKNKDKSLSINELFNYTKENVSRTAGTLDREQTPQLECIDAEKVIIEL